MARNRSGRETTIERALEIRANLILVGNHFDPETGLEMIPGFGKQARFEQGIIRCPLGLKPIRCHRVRSSVA